MIALLLALAAVPDVAGDRLQLACHGGGTANKTDSTSVYAADSSGKSGWANVESQHAEGFEDQVDVWVEGAEGRVRLPRTMLPPIRGGGDGWFKLKDVRIDEGSINATALVNPLNHPKVNIDRRTGVMSIDGKSGHFAGRCERVDPQTQTRKF